MGTGPFSTFGSASATGPTARCGWSACLAGSHAGEPPLFETRREDCTADIAPASASCRTRGQPAKRCQDASAPRGFARAQFRVGTKCRSTSVEHSGG